MFNLLVAGGGWTGRRDEMSNGRIYITPEQQADLKPGGVLNLDKLRSLPAIFAGETDSRDPAQVARVGEILTARQGGSSVIIEYRYFDDVPAIPQNDLIRLAPDLGIDIPRRGYGPFEHTHWAVKEANLYKVLLADSGKSSRTPIVFRLDEPQRVNPNLLSAMMPFAGFGPVWEAIQGAATDNGMEFGRADNSWEHPEIIQDVVALIDRAAIVVCDCTGKNANVFYEMGIAHSFGKEVIIITQNPQDIPFDIAHLRHIRYLGNREGCQQLRAELAERIRTIRSRG